MFGTFSSEELDKLKKGLRELSDVMTMMDSQKEVQKEIIKFLHEELKIPKSLIRKMAVTFHKQNYSEVISENQEFELLYEGIVSNEEN